MSEQTICPICRNTAIADALYCGQCGFALRGGLESAVIGSLPFVATCSRNRRPALLAGMMALGGVAASFAACSPCEKKKYTCPKCNGSGSVDKPLDDVDKHLRRKTEPYKKIPCDLCKGKGWVDNPKPSSSDPCSECCDPCGNAQKNTESMCGG
jgi:hypothetical protein